MHKLQLVWKQEGRFAQEYHRLPPTFYLSTYATVLGLEILVRITKYRVSLLFQITLK